MDRNFLLRLFISLIALSFISCEPLLDNSSNKSIEKHQKINYKVLFKKYSSISKSKLADISTINRNIVGLKVKSDASKIINTLKKYKPEIELKREYSKFIFPGANKFLEKIKAETYNEYFEIFFLPPPNASVSSLIKRKVNFNKGSLLELQLVNSKIIEIYGTPSAKLVGYNRYTLIWLNSHFLSEINNASIDICKKFYKEMKVYQKQANPRDLFLSRRKENRFIINKSKRKATAYGCGDALIIDVYFHKDKINLVHEINYHYSNSNVLIKSFELSNAFMEELIRTNKQTEINILRENSNQPNVEF